MSKICFEFDHNSKQNIEFMTSVLWTCKDMNVFFCFFSIDIKKFLSTILFKFKNSTELKTHVWLSFNHLSYSFFFLLWHSCFAINWRWSRWANIKSSPLFIACFIIIIFSSWLLLPWIKNWFFRLYSKTWENISNNPLK